MVYQLAVSQDSSLHGYINSSLSFFDVSDFQETSVPRTEILSEEFANVTFCRYASVHFVDSNMLEILYL